MAYLAIFVRFMIIALYLVLLGRVIMSWVDPRFEGTLGRFLYETTEPFLAPIRRVLPQSGMFDFSPIVAFIILSIIAAAIGVR